jgi:hypothetical protein
MILIVMIFWIDLAASYQVVKRHVLRGRL